MPQSLAQKRATHALDYILLLRDGRANNERQSQMIEVLSENITELTSGNEYGKFDSYVKALPATIIMNGLGQAVATTLASAKLSLNDDDKRKPRHRAYKILYQILSDWLCRNDEEAPYRGEPELIEAIISKDEKTYLAAQAEAMAYLEWLKKFSNAYLGK